MRLIGTRVADPDGVHPDPTLEKKNRIQIWPPRKNWLLPNKAGLLLLSFDIKVNITNILTLYFHFGSK